MNNISFTYDAWQEYLYWQSIDKKTLKKINELLKDIRRNPYTGLGKPESLRKSNGMWSRRINDKDRLVYKINNDEIIVYQCKGHYDDK